MAAFFDDDTLGRSALGFWLGVWQDSEEQNKIELKPFMLALGLSEHDLGY